MLKWKSLGDHIQNKINVQVHKVTQQLSNSMLYIRSSFSVLLLLG